MQGPKKEAGAKLETEQLSGRGWRVLAVELRGKGGMPRRTLKEVKRIC